MGPRFLVLAILAGLLIGPAFHTLKATPAYDPIAPEGYDGALFAFELSLEESAQRANTIVVGRVSGQTGRQLGGNIVTDVTLDVEKVLKGGTGQVTADKKLTFVNQGGMVGAKQVLVGGAPLFVQGERVLLFLSAGAKPELIQLFTSKYTLSGAQAIQREGRKSREITIPDVERRLKATLGGDPAIGSTANASGPAAFTVMSGCPAWTSSQYPIPHFINDANPAAGADTGYPHFEIIYRSLLMWQELPNSALAFRVAGPTTKPGTDHEDGEHTVAWIDISTVGNFPGVIGLNYCYSNNGVRIDSDTLLHNKQWTWDSNPDNGINGGTLSTRSVAGHEFGHGISLDHSGDPDALMAPSIPTGTNKVLNADDIAGAANRAPLLTSAGPPSTPGTLSVANTSSTSKTLSWGASSNNVIAYDIERATGNCSAPFRSVNTVARTTTTYLDNNYGLNLTPGVVYCYRVKALGRGGDSGYTNATGASSNVCGNPTLISNPNSATLQANSTMVFSGTVSGCSTPSYLWWVFDGTSWIAQGTWTASNSFSWTPTVPQNGYQIAFWAKQQGVADAQTSISAVRNVTAPSNVCGSPTLISNPNSATLQANSTMIFSGTVMGCSAPHYLWWVFDGTSWIAQGTWTASNSFSWTPTVPRNGYQIAFWAKQQGVTDPQTSISVVRNVTPGSNVCGNPTLISNPNSATLQANSTMVFSGTVSGCSAPHYLWWVFDGTSWIAQGTWTASNSFSWTPTVPHNGYQIAFWAKQQGVTDPQTSISAVRNVTPGSNVCGNPTLISNPNSLTLKANSTMVFTGTVAGCSAPNYLWWVFDGTSWIAQGTWTASNSFSWTPTVPHNGYQIAFWAKQQGVTDPQTSISAVRNVTP